MKTYKEFINSILESRGRFACGGEYYERHHIIPKCIGGTNDEENLIDFIILFIYILNLIKFSYLNPV